MPDFKLKVFSNESWEKDFMAAYGDLLLKGTNVRIHNSLNPKERRFRVILNRCFAFIAPTSCEGISPAVATTIQASLYPIISRETAVTLPEGYKTYLERYTTDEIVQAWRDEATHTEDSLWKNPKTFQTLALNQYSREAFISTIRSYLAQAID
jgi:hypothetical protein